MDGVIHKIQLNLAMVRVSLVSGIARLLERGETAERIEAVAKAVSESGKAFERETEKQVSTPWQRCCGKGRWLHWVCPCIPLWHWSGLGQRLVAVKDRLVLLLAWTSPSQRL
jgi:hypothetical protein